MNYKYQNVGLIIMAKAPVPGEVKTRLCPPLTADQAAEVAKKLCTRVLMITTQSLLCPIILATTDQTHPFVTYCRQNFPIQCITQVGNNLGECIGNAIIQQRKRYDKVIVIGMDCPTISADYIEQAIQDLDTHHLVVGPAMDGGYVLLGLKQYHAELFAQVPWGGSAVLETTLINATTINWRCKLLKPLCDIDTIAE